MPSYVSLDTIYRGTAGSVVPVGWADQVNDNFATLWGDTAWTNITAFSGTWAVGGQQPRYSKAGNFVTIQGQISGGTINTAAFTLPAGYRPTESLVFAAVANGAFGQLNVLNTGVVTPVNGSTTGFGIYCTFSTL